MILLIFDLEWSLYQSYKNPPGVGPRLLDRERQGAGHQGGHQPPAGRSAWPPWPSGCTPWGDSCRIGTVTIPDQKLAKSLIPHI